MIARAGLVVDKQRGACDIRISRKSISQFCDRESSLKFHNSSRTSVRVHHSNLDQTRRRGLMSNWKIHSRIPARALMAATIAVGLAACNAQMSASSTANVPDPPAPAADLPEVVITAHALHPGERADDAARGRNDQPRPAAAEPAEGRHGTAAQRR